MKQIHIDEIRVFNRFYTNIIGLLDKYILNSHFTLPEVRILFELFHNEKMTSRDIIFTLHIDKGYLSRILKRFEKKKLILKVRSNNDKRSTFVKLTQLGIKEFMILNEAANNQITEILKQLSLTKCDQLTSNMKSIKKILEEIKG